MFKGFTFPYKGKEVFVITRRKNRTRNLAKDILHAMSLPDGRVDELLYWLRKGRLSYHKIKGERWYSIMGDGYWATGPESNLTVIHLDKETES